MGKKNWTLTHRKILLENERTVKFLSEKLPGENVASSFRDLMPMDLTTSEGSVFIKALLRKEVIIDKPLPQEARYRLVVSTEKNSRDPFTQRVNQEENLVFEILFRFLDLDQFEKEEILSLITEVVRRYFHG